MSVHRMDYVVVGVKLPDAINNGNLWDVFGDNGTDELLSSVTTDTVGLIDDPMMGEYTIAAILLAPLDNAYDGIEYTEVDIESVDLQDKNQKVKDFCKFLFNLDVEPKLLAFSQWS